MDCSREQALAFRFLRGGVGRELPKEALLEAFQFPAPDTPPDTVAQAIAARMAGVEDWQRLLDGAMNDHQLYMVGAMRLNPHAMRLEDVPATTRGLQPVDGDYAPHYFQLAKACRAADFPMEALHPLVVDIALDILVDGPLRMGDLVRLIGQHMPPSFAGARADGGGDIWQYALYQAFMAGCFCYLPKVAGQRMVARIPGAQPAEATDEERRALARMFLRQYAPANLRDFAAWMGLPPSIGANNSLSAARMAWELVQPECETIMVEGKAYSMLAEDVPAMLQAPPPRGWHLLPPRDAYLYQTPRQWLLPEALQKAVWPMVAPPGVALCDGGVAGIWRMRKKGKAANAEAELFPGQGMPREILQEQMERMAAARGLALEDMTVLE